MSSRPKVSVIIAASNNAEHIEECLDSVLSQDFQEFEVIAVDVNSTDGTKEILAETAGEDERVIFLADSMGSIGHAKNMALDRVRTPYVLFVEPEDYLYQDALEYLVKELEENPDTDLYACDTQCFGDDSFGRTNEDIRKVIAEANENDDRTQEMESRVMRSWMFDDIAMYRTSFLNNNNIRHYDEPGWGEQDTAFRFLTMMMGRLSLSVSIQYGRRAETGKRRITEPGTVADVCDEFRFLRKKLKEDQNLWWKSRLVFWQAYYDRNMLLYEKLSDNLRSKLSKRMQADIKDAIYHKEYSREHFDVTVREEMEILLHSVEEFDRYQTDKLLKREKERDEALIREKRLTEIFTAPQADETERLSRENRNRLKELRRKNRLDRKWLLDEMTRDLAPLRMLMGITPYEMGNILGVSENTYKSIETGKKEITWDQYMALLFVFKYNDRTATVADTLGLYPEPLKDRMRKGIIYGYG